MKKYIHSSFLAIVVCMCFFFIPVCADPYDYEYQVIDMNSYNAYMYWLSHGFTFTDAVVADQESSLTMSADVQGCLLVPHVYDSYIQNNGVAITWEGEQQPYTITVGNCSASASNINVSEIHNNRIKYFAPQLSNTSYTPVTSYYYPSAVYVGSGDTFHLAFMTRYGGIKADDISVYSGQTGYKLTRRLVNAVGSYVTYDIALKAVNSGYYNIEVPADISKYTVIPLLANLESTLNDEQRRMIGLQSDLVDQLQTLFNQQNQLLNQGDNVSQASGNKLSNSTSELNSASSDLVGYEDTFSQSLNLSLQSIDPDDNALITQSGFLNSVSWIVARFNDLLSVSAISSVFTFVLVIGIAGLLIGKVK